MYSNNQEIILGAQPRSSALTINKVLKNTYILLALTLSFSSVMAYLSMRSGGGAISPIMCIVGYFGLLFLTQALRNSLWGLVSIFAFTGFMGYTLGPILTFYLKAFSNGSQLITMAFGSTAFIFVGLSGYAITTKKEFNYLGAFLSIGMTFAFIAGLVALFFHMPMLDLFVACAFALLSSGFILFQTSQIIHGGEQNYIMATIALYVSILNLFLSLLRILAAFGGNRE